jgi:hypothetical protein
VEKKGEVKKLIEKFCEEAIKEYSARASEIVIEIPCTKETETLFSQRIHNQLVKEKRTRKKKEAR